MLRSLNNGPAGIHDVSEDSKELCTHPFLVFQPPKKNKTPSTVVNIIARTLPRYTAYSTFVRRRYQFIEIEVGNTRIPIQYITRVWLSILRVSSQTAHTNVYCTRSERTWRFFSHFVHPVRVDRLFFLISFSPCAVFSHCLQLLIAVACDYDVCARRRFPRG